MKKIFVAFIMVFLLSVAFYIAFGTLAHLLYPAYDWSWSFAVGVGSGSGVGLTVLIIVGQRLRLTK